MARPIRDFTNYKFGKLTARYVVKVDKITRVHWLCSCECGNTTIWTSKKILDSGKKGMKQMCSQCRLGTLKHPKKTKLYETIHGVRERRVYRRKDGFA